MKNFSVKDGDYTLKFEIAEEKQNKTIFNVSIPIKNKHDRTVYWTTTKLVEYILKKYKNIGTPHNVGSDLIHANIDSVSVVPLTFLRTNEKKSGRTTATKKQNNKD